MTQDLTKITTPFGLLDAETQEALRAHGGPYQTWYGDEIGWHDHKPSWGGAYAYRVKPQPPKPREWWIVGDCEAWDTYEDAVAATGGLINKRIIRVREVLE